MAIKHKAAAGFTGGSFFDGLMRGDSPSIALGTVLQEPAGGDSPSKNGNGDRWGQFFSNRFRGRFFRIR